MVSSLAILRALLQDSPNNAIITPDGYALYVLWENEVVCFIGPNWNSMTEEQINARLERERAAFFERVMEAKRYEET